LATAHSRAALLLSYRKIARRLELPESATEEQQTTHFVEALLSSNAPVAGLLNRPESAAKEQSLAVDAFNRWLSSNRGWLLILDNADDLTMANQFIPPGKNGHVLLTTQERAVSRMARLVWVI
jgi:hypothetical protein